jgi:hypothetical protein
MTYKQARKLKKKKSYISFAFKNYLFIRLQKMDNLWMIVVEDSPGNEILLLLSSVGYEL